MIDFSNECCKKAHSNLLTTWVIVYEDVCFGMLLLSKVEHLKIYTSGSRESKITCFFGGFYPFFK